MKRISLIFSASLFLLASCGSGDGTPVSTPIDSTNVRGTAPADYSPAPGAEQLPDENAASDYRANTPGGDSLPSQRGVEKTQ
jgi:hypothetical protein